MPSPKGDLVSVGFLPGTAVPGSGFLRPFRDWFAEKICGRDGIGQGFVIDTQDCVLGYFQTSPFDKLRAGSTGLD